MFVVLFWKSLVAFGAKLILPSKEEDQQPTRPNWEISPNFQLGNDHLMEFRAYELQSIYMLFFSISQNLECPIYITQLCR